MAGKGHALARDELIRVLTAYTGVTTEDGLGDGTTLIDTNLKDNPSISEFAIPEKTILIMSGAAIQEDKRAASFDNGTGKIILQGTGFSTQITAGTTFRILNISSVEIDVADIDTKIGTNVDAPGTTTLFAWMAKIFAAADVAAIEAKLDVQKGVAGVFYEQADAAINESVDNTEHFVVAITTVSTRYILRNLRLKSADPGVGETITVKLYEFINDGEVNVDSFVIDHDNYGTYHSLMDMFGLPQIAGDSIKVSLTGSTAGPVVVTGQYSHAKTNV